MKNTPLLPIAAFILALFNVWYQFSRHNEPRIEQEETTTMHFKRYVTAEDTIKYPQMAIGDFIVGSDKVVWTYVRYKHRILLTICSPVYIMNEPIDSIKALDYRTAEKYIQELKARQNDDKN